MCRRIVCVERWCVYKDGVCRRMVCVGRWCVSNDGVFVCKNGVCVCIRMRYRSTCGTECVCSGQFRFSCAVSSI